MSTAASLLMGHIRKLLQIWYTAELALTFETIESYLGYSRKQKVVRQ